MCGRFALNATAADLATLFNLSAPPPVHPRYNIAPGTEIQAVRRIRSGGENELGGFLWWLIPHWSKTKELKYAAFNAVSETVGEKPAFRAAFKQGRRCLVPVSGFYEWKNEEGGKQPYYFTPSSGGLFALAGLWERWEREGDSLESCCILTAPANELIRPIHTRNRMPVILESSDFNLWLEPATDPEEAQSLCRTYPAEKMNAHPVTRNMNRTGYEDPECIRPLKG